MSERYARGGRVLKYKNQVRKKWKKKMPFKKKIFDAVGTERIKYL